MKYTIDLHIHSCLSPCGDNEMTPNNIVNMALLKGLDIIAVTDHNSAENVKAIMECAEDKGIVVVPGIEAVTAEEVHVVCYFNDLKNTLKMQEIIYSSLPDRKNNADIFGRQIICDREDNITGEVERMLITATNIGIDNIFNIVGSLGGVAIPAHIDRDSYSVLANLGFVPESYKGCYLETSKDCDYKNLSNKLNGLASAGYKLYKSSDAHYLKDIFERQNFIELPQRSVSAVIQRLKSIRKI